MRGTSNFEVALAYCGITFRLAVRLTVLVVALLVIRVQLVPAFLAKEVFDRLGEDVMRDAHANLD